MIDTHFKSEQNQFLHLDTETILSAPLYILLAQIKLDISQFWTSKKCCFEGLLKILLVLVFFVSFGIQLSDTLQTSLNIGCQNLQFYFSTIALSEPFDIKDIDA